MLGRPGSCRGWPSFGLVPKVVGWELPATVVLARGTRRGNLDPTVCNAMTGSGLCKSPSGTWGRMLCVSACLLVVLALLRRSVILLCARSSGIQRVSPGLLWLARRFFCCWESGCSRTHLAPSAHAVGGGKLMSAIFTFCTAFSCRSHHVARRWGRGGGARRDNRYCDVPH